VLVAASNTCLRRLMKVLPKRQALESFCTQESAEEWIHSVLGRHAVNGTSTHRPNHLREMLWERLNANMYMKTGIPAASVFIPAWPVAAPVW
jgi:hypothetical protein